MILSSRWRRRYGIIVRTLNSPIEYPEPVDSSRDSIVVEEAIDSDSRNDTVVEEAIDSDSRIETVMEASVDSGRNDTVVEEAVDSSRDDTAMPLMGSFIDVETGRRRSARLATKNNTLLGSFIDGSTGRRRSARLGGRKN
jgi:hypothetical protein